MTSAGFPINIGGLEEALVLVQTLKGASLEDRVSRLQLIVNKAPAGVLQDFQRRLDMSWIYHDSALEGVVYTQDELVSALSDKIISDTSLIPVYDEIRQHRAAIALIRDLCQKKRVTLGLDLIKKIYVTLAPDEAEGKGNPKYRKDMPVHRQYFHEIAAPEKITHQMRQLVAWMRAPETKRSTHTVRLAARAHHKLLHIYPYPKHSGKVARLLMNLILMRQGYPPAIIHATERQRYYDALKGSPNAVSKLVGEALAASVESTIRYFEEELGLPASSVAAG